MDEQPETVDRAALRVRVEGESALWQAAVAAMVLDGGHLLWQTGDPPADVVFADRPPSHVAEGTVAVIGGGSAEHVRRRLEALVHGADQGGLALTAGRLDLAAGVLRRGEADVPLTTTEARLMRCLAGRLGAPIERGTLLRRVWGISPDTATRTLDNTVRRLRRKIEVDPGTPRHLLTVHGVGYALVPAARTVVAPPTNLPVDREPLIGREGALAEVGAALRHTRLVTLTGCGGIGKTHLVHAVGRHVLARFAPGGVWLCDLTEARGPAGIEVAVSAALGVRSTEGLGRAMASRGTLLLVLDNVEQVAETVATYAARWLAEAPGLKILLTSRQPLGVPGEVQVRLGPLPLGDGVRLFVARARRVRPGFRLNATDRAHVDAIVDGLDGVPMAIALAAGRTAVLEVPAIRHRLSGVLDLLTAPGDQGRAHRMRATIAWSWAALPPRHQEVARRCAVFRDGFTAAAAEAVCACADTLDALQALVDRSLFHAVADGRLRIFLPIRAFLEEQLEAAGEGAAVRGRHAGWFARVAREAAEVPAGGGRAVRVQAFLPDAANIAAGHRTLMDAVGAEADALTWAHAIICRRRGPFEAGLAALAARLDRSAGAPDWQVRLLSLTADLVWALGERGRFAATAQRALAMAATLEGPHRAVALLAAATLAADPATCRQLADEAQALLGGVLGEGEAHHAVARMALGSGRLHVAFRHLVASVAAYGRGGDLRLGGLLGHVGAIFAVLSALPGAEDAEAILQAVLAQSGAGLDPATESELVAFLAYLALLQGDAAGARDRLLRCLTLQRSVGYHSLRRMALTWLGLTEWVLGDLAAARRRLESAVAEAWSTPTLLALASAMAAAVADRMGEPDAAEIHATNAAEVALDRAGAEAVRLFLACAADTSASEANAVLAESDLRGGRELAVLWGRRMLQARLENAG